MEFELLDLLEDDVEILEIIEVGIPRQRYGRKEYFYSFDELSFYKRFHLTKQMALLVLEQIEARLECPFNRPFKYALPSLFCALRDRRQKWIFTRYVLSYLIGISLAVVFWEVTIRNLDLPLDCTYGSLIALIIILGLGFVFTTAIKCIAFLAFVGLSGKFGRSFLRALCFAYIISGPISNLALNGEEIVRVFACTTILTYNLTKTRFDLMTKPFQNTLSAMKGEMAEIRNNFNNIEDVLQPIKDEIDGEFTNSSESTLEKFVRQDLLSTLSFMDPRNATERLALSKNYQDRYSNKMRLRCKDQLQKAENRCTGAFSDAHENCMQMLPFVIDELLCWPLRIDYVCNMQLLGYSEVGGICDPSNVIDPKLGENMVNLKEMEYDLFHNATDVKMSYEVVKLKQPPQLKAAKETAKAVMEEVKEKKRMFDYVMTIMQKILSFVFLRIIHSSIIYRTSYLKRIDFDNIYITKYFKKIDERRKAASQQSLLPLKKFEQKVLVDTEDPYDRSKEESTAATYYLLQFLLELLVSGFFLLLDHMLIVLLTIVASKSEITYYQEGEHVISFRINGTGLLARLMRTTLKNFNMHERISTFLSNESCLPKPSILPRRYYISLAGVYIMTLLLIYNSSFTLRSRRYICSFFYRKREKQRVLHLYNNMLKQRKSLFEDMYLKVKANIEGNRLKMNFNLFLWLRLNCQTYFGWLRWFRIARRKCLICGEPEPRNQDSGSIKFIECSNANCKFVHCEECWLDVEEVCMACQKEEKVLKYCHDLIHE